MDTLNLYQLRILAAVVEHGSFGRAARSLNLTQPAVSAQIRHLKRLAQAPILVRDGRRVVLTEAGRALYRYAQQMLGATEVLRRDLIEIGAGERDRIIVGGSLAYATYVLPPVVASFQQAHPHVWISVVDGRSGDMIEGVRTGALDAAVVTSSRVPRSSGDDLFVASLGTDDVIVIEAAGGPFSTGPCEPVQLNDLAQVPFVRISGRPSLAATLDPFLAGAGLEPARTMMELGTWEGVKDAVRLGLGKAVVFRSVVQREISRGELREVKVDGFQQSRGLALICSPRRRRERMTEVFQDLLAHIATLIPLSIGQDR